MHKYLYLVTAAFIATQSITAEEMNSLLGSTLSEALYLAEELPSVNKPDYLGPNALAVSPDHATLYVTAEGSRELLFVDLATQSVSRRVELPASPTGLAVAPDGGEIYVTCMSEFLPVGVVAVVSADGSGVVRSFEAGHSPRSPVISPDGSVLYVCCRFADKVCAYSTATGTEKWETDVEREPYAMEITPDGGTLVVANYLPAGRNNVDTLAAKIAFVDAVGGALTGTASLPNGGQSCTGLAISEDGRYAYVTHVSSLHTMTPVNRIDNGWINHSKVSIFDVASKNRLAHFILGTQGSGFGNSWDLSLHGDGMTVSGAGVGEIADVDLSAMHSLIENLSDLEQLYFSLALSAQFVQRKTVSVLGARATVRFNDTVIVAGHFSGDLEVRIARDSVSVAHIDLHVANEQTASRISAPRQGERWFNDAKNMAFQGWHSCNSCHPEGRTCALKRDLENDGNGNFKDTRSTLLAHATAPSMITGVRDSLGMAVRSKIQYVLFWDPAQLEDRAKLIEQYIASLRPFPSPAFTKSGLSQAALRGKEMFRQLNCGECHPESTWFTDMKRHEGRKTSEDAGPLDGIWDTPTLHELWRTAPYGYNGSCATLQELFYSPISHGIDQNLTDGQITDLVEYLRAL